MKLFSKKKNSFTTEVELYQTRLMYSSSLDLVNVLVCLVNVLHCRVEDMILRYMDLSVLIGIVEALHDTAGEPASDRYIACVHPRPCMSSSSCA